MLPQFHRCSDPFIYTYPNPSKRIAVFMDRDGTIIEEKHYLRRIADIKLFPGVASSLRKLTNLGLSLYLFTNQAGVAHGYFDETALANIHRHLMLRLRAAGVGFRGVLYCPHHPKAEVSAYCHDCFGRKPNPGLLYQTAIYDKVDLKKSYVIGDKLSDIKAGKLAGAKTILVLTGYGRQELTHITEELSPDHIAINLPEATDWIIARL